MLNITMSHRLDVLARALLSRLETVPASPFAAEELIVPSAAMRQHLSLLMADFSGICANVRFSYLAEWFWDRIGKVLPVAKESPYSAPRLSWRIFHILGDTGFVSLYPRLENWLKDNDAAARYELACLLASLFEQYITYRPDWLLTWFEGQSLALPESAVKGRFWPDMDEAWQAALWREIEKQIGSDGVHPSVRFFAALEADTSLAAALPGTLHVFCLPAMAPQYLAMLDKISQWMEVELYVFNPCREFWLDVVSEKRLSILETAGQQAYHETGNALLAAWGRQCQAQLSLLMALDDNWDFIAKTGSNDDSPSLLASLQESVFCLEEPMLLELAENDRSVEVHVCHSLMREVEVLYDQLLACFAADDTLEPADIVVVTPDMDMAAPMVDAVFGNAISGLKIPYRIMGRRENRRNEISRALTDVMALATSRFTAADLYDLLLQPLVAARFGLEDELDEVYAWLNESGICWGLDGEQKASMGLPLDDSRSFHDGFYRLFLAYALPQASMLPFGSRLPAGNPEGSAAIALGSLWDLVERLRHLRLALSSARDAAGWRELLLSVLEDFVSTDQAVLEDDLAVREAIARLYDAMTDAGGNALVDADVVRRALSDALDESTRGSVPTGAVTFTSMAGLRYLPYRIVCVIGLNDGAFPSESRPLEFDLLAKAPRLGDHQRREDESNVFLDLFLSARERFYLSYTGKSIRDNSEKPPSIVISELLACMVRALAKDKSKAALDAAREKVESKLVLEHPLQSFSSRYFKMDTDPRMRSAHSDFCLAQQKRQEARMTLPSTSIPAEDWDEEDTVMTAESMLFFTNPLPPPDEMWRDISLSDLIRFFMNPCQYLLQNRMGLSLPSYELVLPSNEPLVSSALDTYQLAERLLPLLVEGRNMDEVLEAAHAGMEYPSGAMGQMLIEGMLDELLLFTSRFSGELAVGLPEPLMERLPFELDGESWSLFGSLPELRENGLLDYRFAGADSDGSVRHRIRIWITHLFLNAAAPPGVVPETVCYFRDAKIRFSPCTPDEAKGLLGELIGLYRQGLLAPLRFFPVSAAAYVDGGEKIQEAYRKWQTGYDGRAGEGDDVFNRLATRGLDEPLDDAFVDCAKRVMGPLHARMSREDYGGNI